MRSASVALALRVSKNLALALISAERRAQRALSPSMKFSKKMLQTVELNAKITSLYFLRPQRVHILSSAHRHVLILGVCTGAHVCTPVYTIEAAAASKSDANGDRRKRPAAAPRE
jgi:hypothetical protein